MKQHHVGKISACNGGHGWIGLRGTGGPDYTYHRADNHTPKNCAQFERMVVSQLLLDIKRKEISTS